MHASPARRQRPDHGGSHAKSSAPPRSPSPRACGGALFRVRVDHRATGRTCVLAHSVGLTDRPLAPPQEVRSGVAARSREPDPRLRARSRVTSSTPRNRLQDRLGVGSTSPRLRQHARRDRATLPSSARNGPVQGLAVALCRRIAESATTTPAERREVPRRSTAVYAALSSACFETTRLIDRWEPALTGSGESPRRSDEDLARWMGGRGGHVIRRFGEEFESEHDRTRRVRTRPRALSRGQRRGRRSHVLPARRRLGRLGSDAKHAVRRRRQSWVRSFALISPRRVNAASSGVGKGEDSAPSRRRDRERDLALLLHHALWLLAGTLVALSTGKIWRAGEAVR